MSCYLFRKIDTQANHLTANLGFVVRNKNTHETQFYTFSISVPNMRYVNHPTQGAHSEGALYYFLQQDDVINPIIIQLRAQVGEGDFQVYAVILDLFTQRDMCGDCQHSTFDYLRGSTEAVQAKVRERLRHYNFTTMSEITLIPNILIPDRYRLRWVIRISATTAYPYGNAPHYHAGSREKTPRINYPKFYEKVEDIVGIDFFETENTQPKIALGRAFTENLSNIENFQNGVILHVLPSQYDLYKSNQELNFLQQFNPVYNQQLAIPKQTVFISRQSAADTPLLARAWRREGIDNNYFWYTQELVEQANIF